MPSIKRRHFLQFAGSAMGAIALSQFDILRQGDRYARVLAQETPRKLALLVGINDYNSAGISSLNGCVNDVYLQKYLLMYRFGFKEEDIVTVFDDPDGKSLLPTRANILQAFQEHLIDQAKPGDVVVFHYSGHGAQVDDPAPITFDACPTFDGKLNGTMVPRDGAVVSQSDRGVVVPDIMGRSLFLLTHAIDTDHVTVVLDSCFSGSGTRGNVAVRAANPRITRTGQTHFPSEEELEFQQRWLSNLGWDEAQFQRYRMQGIAKGVAIGSALCDQEAIDDRIGDFNAGTFTYLLTRYLWQQPTAQAAQTVYDRLDLSVQSRARTSKNNHQQAPVFEYQPNTENHLQPVYFLSTNTPPAEAVITQVHNAEQIEFWLGGVSAQALERAENGTIFAVLNADREAIAEIEQTRRVAGTLYADGRLISGDVTALQAGLLLREQVLGLPTNPKLKVGVDPAVGEDLEAIETELASISWVDVVPVNTQTSLDCILGRFTEDIQLSLRQPHTTGLPPIGSMGLFSKDLSPLNVNLFGRVNESTIAAVNRLRPRFKLLLANQILDLLTVGQGSPLAVKATLSASSGEGGVVETISRGAQEAGFEEEGSTPQFRSGSTLQVTVENLEQDLDLYVSVLVINATGAIDILYPSEWEDPEAFALVERGKSLVVPRPEDEFVYRITGTSGFPEILVLTSREPLRNALIGMQAIAEARSISRGPLGNLNAEELDVLNLVLDDLDTASRGQNNARVTRERVGDRTSLYDKELLAVLSGTIEVIP